MPYLGEWTSLNIYLPIFGSYSYVDVHLRTNVLTHPYDQRNDKFIEDG
jgi:hypothetical protein